MCLFGVARASQQVAARQVSSCVLEKDVLNVPSAAVTIAARRLWESVFTMTGNVSGSLLRPAAARAPEVSLANAKSGNRLDDDKKHSKLPPLFVGCCGWRGCAKIDIL